jgi:hypothetical protein
MSVQLPAVVARYFAGSNAHDADACAACFASDAVVMDERRERIGIAEIRAWKQETIDKYHMHADVRDVTAEDQRADCSHRTRLGNFNGSPVDLRFGFRLTARKSSGSKSCPDEAARTAEHAHAAFFDAAVITRDHGERRRMRTARRGNQVIGLDQYQPGHDRGCSHGESRAFRLAHFEGLHYSALARDALAGWRRLEEATGEAILTSNGILECGPQGSENLEKSLHASIDNGLQHEVLPSRAVAKRFPAFQLPPDWRAAFQKEVGSFSPGRDQMLLQIAKRWGRSASR